MQNVIISIDLLAMGGSSIFISDQEDESIWKILAMENWLPDVGFITGYYSTTAFEERLSSFSMISFASEAVPREGASQRL